MIIIKAIGNIFESVAKVVTNTSDVAVMATDYAKETLTDESIKRDLEATKSILDLKKELDVSDHDIAEVQAMRAMRLGIDLPKQETKKDEA